MIKLCDSIIEASFHIIQYLDNAFPNIGESQILTKFIEKVTNKKIKTTDQSHYSQSSVKYLKD